jgi:hypothetical protein
MVMSFLGEIGENEEKWQGEAFVRNYHEVVMGTGDL